MIIKHTAQFLTSQRVAIEGLCLSTKRPWVLVLSQEEYRNWKTGVVTHTAFPSLTPSEHQLLMSGIIPEEVSGISFE